MGICLIIKKVEILDKDIKDSTKLFLIKLLHTTIWFFFVFTAVITDAWIILGKKR